MRMARDGRLCKGRAVDWPRIFQRLASAAVWREFQGRVPRAADPRTHWLAKTVVLCFALMGWAQPAGLVERFAESRAVLAALYPNRRRPGGSLQGLLKAGGRFTPAVFVVFWRCLRGRFAQLLGAGWHWHGWIVFGVDGSRIEAPRTRANQRRLGCAGRAGSGPQWWVTTLVHLPSRLLWSWRQGPGAASERGHLWQMRGELPPGTLLLADAGFVGFSLLRDLLAQQTDFLIRCGGNVTLLLAGMRQQIESCGSSRIVYLWPGKQRRRPPLRLRLIRLKRGGRSIYLLTSVLDPARLPVRIAGELYTARWGLELNFRGLKQTLERRKLLARTPQTGELELAGNIVALGLLLAHAACLLRAQTQRVSIAQLLRLLRGALAALRWRRRPPRLRHAARSICRDEYQRRRRKRARDWPRKKTQTRTRAPILRKMNNREKKLISAWNQAKLRTIG